MRICLLGLENLSVLAPEYGQHNIAGEGVQQTLLAKAFARRGHEVRMVTWDYGQAVSEHCRAYVAREHGENTVLRAYLEAFEVAMRPDLPAAGNPLHA